MTIKFNESESKAIPPMGDIPSTERYHGTAFYDSYNKGMLAAKATLDEKNKEKILDNLIKVVLDDILEQNSKNISANSNILKLNMQVIENALKNTKLSNFNFDPKRVASIIEGYGKFIEQKNN
tara:strand:+ start:337 stop:705 length:369 start_codon:yes stop_codon:yes gene_type:complete